MNVQVRHALNVTDRPAAVARTRRTVARRQRLQRIPRMSLITGCPGSGLA